GPAPVPAPPSPSTTAPSRSTSSLSCLQLSVGCGSAAAQSTRCATPSAEPPGPEIRTPGSRGCARGDKFRCHTVTKPGLLHREALARGFTSTGLNVLDVGVVPTPLTYFAANTLPVDGLAMITGSHNPPEYNGFKIGAGKTTFHGAEIQALRKLIEARDFEK